eukprot:m.44594 g.44594  ORF g.44594 m.44594 type:complete len:81 (-) comp7181_c0_seq2:1383-1625(-)
MSNNLYKGTVPINKVVRNFDSEDIVTIGLGTVITAACGFAVGNKQARVPMAWGAAFIGFTGAFSLAVMTRTQKMLTSMES